MKCDVARLKTFFLEMAATTYASGEKAVKMPGSEWKRTFEKSEEDLTYRDCYMVSGEYSGGTTVILVNNVPAWVMQYHGWCKNDNPQVLAFLKEALTAAYERREFHGGRGLPRFQGTNLLYTNSPQVPRHIRHEEDFAGFIGHEQIQLPDVTVVFWHRYQGMLFGEPK